MTAPLTTRLEACKTEDVCGPVIAVPVELLAETVDVIKEMAAEIVLLRHGREVEQEMIRNAAKVILDFQKKVDALEDIAKTASELGLSTACVVAPDCGDCAACRFQTALRAFGEMS